MATPHSKVKVNPSHGVKVKTWHKQTKDCVRQGTNTVIWHSGVSYNILHSQKRCLLSENTTLYQLLKPQWVGWKKDIQWYQRNLMQEKSSLYCHEWYSMKHQNVMKRTYIHSSLHCKQTVQHWTYMLMQKKYHKYQEIYMPRYICLTYRNSNITDSNLL